MIPLHKLKKLPRRLQLRKISKLLGEAEHHLAAGLELPASEEWVCVVELLAQDTLFPPEMALVIKEAETALKSAADRQSLRRNLNAIRHILLSETGRAPADWDFIDPAGHLDPQKRRCFPGVRVYLEDIRAPFNVGAMFRTAESFGVEKIVISPLCADPNHPRAERTAKGCVSVLPWERLSHDRGIQTMQGPLFALETGGTRLGDFQFPSQGIMVIGSEELGVSPQTLAAAEASLGRVSIPIYGAKGSLNASVAFGIAMQAWAETLQR